MRKRKRESEDPEEPRKRNRNRETLGFSQGPTPQLLEDSNTAKARSKRKREASEEGEHAKRIKPSPIQEEDCEDSSSTGKQPERPISISSDSSCSLEEKRCSLVTIDDLSSDGQSSIIVISDPSGEQVVSERLTKSSRGSSCSFTSREGSSDELVTALKSNDHYSKAEFETRYTQEKMIGQGAYGSVFAGFRNCDSLPVAIKYIPQMDARYTDHGKEGRVPLEIALLTTVKDVAAVITLLDWYDLGSKVVLVMERPERCTNLLYYAFRLKCGFEEQSMKDIGKQLVDAFVEIHSKGVLHKDLHLQNILMELGSTAPRVRIIDFGCGLFSKSCEPLTVYQIGKVLRDLLEFSPDCNPTEDFKDFLSACLEPGTESSLHGLQCHPWLKT